MAVFKDGRHHLIFFRLFLEERLQCWALPLAQGHFGHRLNVCNRDGRAFICRGVSPGRFKQGDLGPVRINLQMTDQLQTQRLGLIRNSHLRQTVSRLLNLICQGQGACSKTGGKMLGMPLIRHGPFIYLEPFSRLIQAAYDGSEAKTIHQLRP